MFGCSCCQIEKPRAPKPSSEDVKPARSMVSQPSFTAGLARVIDRERPSYQQLAEKVAADEQLALASILDVQQTTTPRMVDAGVQSDHAVDLLAATQCSTKARKETATTSSEKVDKATLTDGDWPLSTGTDEDFADTADEVERLVVETVDKDTATVPSELSDKNRVKQKAEECTIVSRTRSARSSTKQRLPRVQWADEGKVHGVTSLVKQRSENFADELLLLAPWAPQASVSKLNLRRLERQKALLARSTEHMVIIEAESTEERPKLQAAARTETVDGVVTDGLLNDTVDRVTTKRLLNNRVEQNSTEPAVYTHSVLVEVADGN